MNVSLKPATFTAQHPCPTPQQTLQRHQKPSRAVGSRWRLRNLSLILPLLFTVGCDLAVRSSLTNTAGLQPNGDSLSIKFSEDGRYAVFFSSADNIDVADFNSDPDIFLVDHVDGSRKLISRNAAGNSATGASRFPNITPDGRYIVFSSEAEDLVATDSNNVSDVFVFDTTTGVMERVSVDSSEDEGKEGSLGGSISDDGRYVVFYTDNAFANDSNRSSDVYLRDRSLGTTRLMSTNVSNSDAAGDSFNPVISGDGSTVVWEAGNDNVIAGDSNGYTDIIWRTTGLLIKVLISTPNAGGQADDHSFSPDVSYDGSYVVFDSRATNLVANDLSGDTDVFRWDINNAPSNPLERLSINATAGVQPNGPSFWPNISADGSQVVYASAADNLQTSRALTLDTNGLVDVYLWENGVNKLGSRTVLHAAANGQSVRGAISPDGSVIGYDSAASNLGFQDTNGVLDVYARASFVPLLNTVSGGPLVRGQTTVLMLSGIFAPDTGVLVTDDGVLAATLVNLTPTTATLVVTLSASASLGPRKILITAPTPQLGQLAPIGAADSENIVVVN